MKKFVSLLLCLSMLLMASVLTTSALSPDVNDDTWSAIELKGLIVHQGEFFFSDMAKDYEADWLYVDIDGIEQIPATLNARGFALSPDLKYAYWGFLNGGTGLRGCMMMNLENGQATDLYYHYEEENLDTTATRYSFPKGIAADDRGYVYVGFALSSNYNVVNLGIAQVNEENNTLEEVSLTPVYEWGQPGDVGGIKIGVNGVEVAKIGDRYYCYCMVNYDYDSLVCYDVTDPVNPTLNRDFGTDGQLLFVNDDCPVFPEGTRLDDGNFLDVDEDGTIWLCAKYQNGNYGIMKIAPDGSVCATSFETETSAFTVAHVGHYLVMGDKKGESVLVYDDVSFEKIASVKFDTDMYGCSIPMIQVIDDILFVVCADGDNGTAFNALLAAGLTTEAEARLEEMAEKLNGDSGEETGDDTGAAVDSDTTAEDTAGETESVAGDTTPTTSAETSDGAATEMNTATIGVKESGCASVVGMSAVLVLALAGLGVLIKKKD